MENKDLKFFYFQRRDYTNIVGGILAVSFCLIVIIAIIGLFMRVI